MNSLSTHRSLVGFLLISASLALLVLPVISALPWTRAGHTEPQASSQVSSQLPQCGQRSAADSWELVDTIERELEIDKRGQSFLRFHNDTGELEIMSELHYEDALGKEAREAVERAPFWLRGNLSRKLVYAGIRGFSSNRSAAEFSDLDGDGTLDLFLTHEDGVRFFTNSGSSYLHLYREENELFDPASLANEDGLLHPAIGDMDGDGDMDLGIGGMNFVSLYENTGTCCEPEFRYVDRLRLGTGPRPEIADMNNDGFADMMVGMADGSLEYWVNGGSGDITDLHRNLPFLVGTDVGEDASPACGDLDGDGDLDLVVGSSTTVLHHFENIGNPSAPLFAVDDRTLFSGIRAGNYLSPSLAPVETDALPDLILTSSMDQLLIYDNIGSSFSPDFRISSTYEVWPGTSYYPPNEHLRIVDEEPLAELVDLLLSCPDNLVDEIAFSISNTADDVLLRGEVSADMFLENARYIYDTAPLLDYVELVEAGSMNSGDYHTTTRYRVLEDGHDVYIDLPRDIYYRFIVHPKVTEEYPCFIDPDTGDPASPAPAGNGRFWREFLFFHSDVSYPEDPDPGDELDRYPENDTPPLMRELLSGVKYLYNCTPWNAPAGRPPLYGDHAIIRVSNWVGKTLVLNQQEVSDGERPTQPVRIAHHHNGNCGELQDLTVAAARCALVPASGIIMLGEDHVWIEFWERGWHQWDNYWSDGGSIIDNWGNYWYGWGERGGSGIYKWHGNDMIEDVTTHYVPREVLSDVMVKVTDRNGAPVDGARAVIGSHWMIEHQTDTPVTAPFPSIWNYTDSNGIASFTLTSNNISIKVISRLGNGVVTKTYIEPGTKYWFNVTLEGSKPRRAPNIREIDQTEEGEWLVEYDMEVVGAFQRPPNANTGSFHTRPIPGGLHMDFAIFPGSQMGRVLGNRRADCYLASLDSGRFSGTLRTTDDTGVVFWLRNCDQVETYKKIMLRVKVSRKVEINDTFPPVLMITGPENDTGYISGDDIDIRGSVVDDSPVTGLMLSVDRGIWLNITEHLADTLFEYRLKTSDWTKGNHIITVRAQDACGNEAQERRNIVIEEHVPVEPLPPGIIIHSHEPFEAVELGELVTIRASVRSDPIITGILYSTQGESNWLDGMGFFDEAEGEFIYELNTTGMNIGILEFSIKVENEHGLASEANLELEMRDSTPPEIRVTEPSSGDGKRTDETLMIEVETSDLSKITRLDVELVGTGIRKRFRERDPEEKMTFEVDLAELDTGSYNITARATDGAGNEAEDVVNFTIEDEKEIAEEEEGGWTVDPGIVIGAVLAGIILLVGLIFISRSGK